MLGTWYDLVFLTQRMANFGCLSLIEIFSNFSLCEKSILIQFIGEVLLWKGFLSWRSEVCFSQTVDECCNIFFSSYSLRTQRTTTVRNGKCALNFSTIWYEVSSDCEILPMNLSLNMVCYDSMQTIVANSQVLSVALHGSVQVGVPCRTDQIWDH